jgi:hypothetical protein
LYVSLLTLVQGYVFNPSCKTKMIWQSIPNQCFFLGKKITKFFSNFWLNIHKLGFQGGGEMDFSPNFDYGKLCHIGFGASFQDLSPLKWCPHIVTSPNIALIVDHITIFYLYTHRFPPLYAFWSKSFAKSILLM